MNFDTRWIWVPGDSDFEVVKVVQRGRIKERVQNSAAAQQLADAQRREKKG